MVLSALVLPVVVYVAPGAPADAQGTRSDPVRLETGVLARADEVRLLPGDYELPEGLLVEGRTRPLRLVAVEPGKATLYGGRFAEPERDGRRLALRTGSPASGILEDGRPMRLARAPNSGYFRTLGAGGRAATEFVVAPAEARLLRGDLRYVEVFSWPGHDWFSNRGPVTAWSPDSRTVASTELPGYAYEAGDRYRLEGDVRFLDSQGEFARTDDGAVLLPARTSARYVVVTAPDLLTVRDSVGVSVFGLAWVGAKRDAVRIEDSSGTDVRSCAIRGAGETGIKSVGSSSGGQFVGNLVELNGQHGIDMEGPGDATGPTNGQNVVRSNRVRDNGLRFGHGYGIAMHFSGGNVVEHNHVSGQPRYGITLKGDSPPTVDAEGMKVWRPGEYRPTSDNLIRFNRVENVNLDSEDTGAIESWNAGPNNTIDANWIGDSGNAGSPIMSGLYLDDGADGFTVTRNVIVSGTGAEFNQPIFVKGVDNHISGNLLVVRPDGRNAITSMEMAGLAARRHRYVRNLIWFAPRPGRLPNRLGFGKTANNLQEVGTTLRTPFISPRKASVDVWVRYASRSADFGVPTMSGQSSVRVGDSRAALQELDNTQGWDDLRWTPAPAARLEVPAGATELVWVNDLGGGINIDAFLLDYGRDWLPNRAPEGQDLVVVHPEQETFPEQFSIVHWLVNDGRERIGACDLNYLAGDTRELRAFTGAAMIGWSEWLARGYDLQTRVVQVRLADPQRGDYRIVGGLPPGFEPLPFDQMGLGPEYPSWLAR